MKDPLKAFIDHHRDAFDDSTPSPELPDKIIAARKHEVRRTIRNRAWTVMAAATLAAGLLLTIARLHPTGQDIPSPESLTGGEDLTKAAGQAAADSSLREIDLERALQLEVISQQATARLSELETLRKDNPGLYRRFLQDLARLDSHYLALRDMLERMPNQRQVMQAMEENLRTRLRLLERQGQLIRESKGWNKPRS